jgi:hypothetical protein
MPQTIHPNQEIIPTRKEEKNHRTQQPYRPRAESQTTPTRKFSDKASNTVAPQQARENHQTKNPNQEIVPTRKESKESKKTIERSSPAVPNYPQPGSASNAGEHAASGTPSNNEKQRKTIKQRTPQNQPTQLGRN